MPEIAVVIPTRNRSDLLFSSALPAALGQQDVDLEAIVVDDASSDSTSARLAEVRDPRLRVVRQERRTGVAGARNRGIRESDADWVAFLDDDDLWSPRKLRTQLDVADARAADFAYAAAVHIDENRSVLALLSPPQPQELSSRLASGSALPAGGSNVIVRSDLLRRVGGFDERFSHLADWDLWIRVEHAGRGAACADVLVAERLHADNMRLVSTASVWGEFCELRDKHRAAGAAAIELDGGPLLEWLAAEHERAGRRRQAARDHLRAAAAARSPRRVLRAMAALVSPRRQPAPQRRTRAGRPPIPDWLASYR